MLKTLILISFLAILIVAQFSAGNSDPILKKGVFPTYYFEPLDAIPVD
jgi:hypothetical protein